MAHTVQQGQHAPKCGTLALGGGFAVAFAIYFGTEGLLTPSSWQWVFWAAVASLPIGPLASGKWGRQLGGIRILLVLTAVSTLLLQPMLQKLVPHEFGNPEVWAWSLGLGLVAALSASAMESSAKHFPAKRLLPAWLLYASLFAGLVFELGSARLGQMAGFLAAGWGAFLVMAWVFPQRRILTTASFAFALVLMQVAANAYFFGYDVQGLPLLLAGLPPLLFGLATRWRWLQKAKAVPAGAILAGMAILPLLSAYAVTVFTAEVDPYGGADLPY